MKFQDDISNMNTYIHTYVHTYIRTSRNQYVPYFFKIGGIITPKVLAPSSQVFIITICLENRNKFARFDEIPSMTL